MCYHAEFGPSALKGVSINGEEPKIGEHCNSSFLGLQAWLTPRYMTLTTGVTLQGVGVLRKRCSHR